jgi:hypothetical protein
MNAMSSCIFTPKRVAVNSRVESLSFRHLSARKIIKIQMAEVVKVIKLKRHERYIFRYLVLVSRMRSQIECRKNIRMLIARMTTHSAAGRTINGASSSIVAAHHVTLIMSSVKALSVQ